MARNKYNELKKARKAKMQRLRLQHAIWGTLLVVLSLVIAYMSPALLFGDFMGSQATVGGFTANMLAIVSTTFNKMSADFYVKGGTFGYSVLAFIVVGYICASCPHRIA